MQNLVDRATEKLRSNGGRMTAQRRVLLEILDSLSGHPTAEELYELARQRDPNLHLSTVYRTLRWLQGEGLISSRWFQEPRRQERFDPNRPSEHYHFVCISCQGVIEFVEPLLTHSVQQEFSRRFGATVEQTSLVFYGQCMLCKANPKGGTSAGED